MEKLGDKPAPVPFCPPKISLKITGFYTNKPALNYSSNGTDNYRPMFLYKIRKMHYKLFRNHRSILGLDFKEQWLFNFLLREHKLNCEVYYMTYL